MPLHPLPPLQPEDLGFSIPAPFSWEVHTTPSISADDTQGADPGNGQHRPLCALLWELVLSLPDAPAA